MNFSKNLMFPAVDFNNYSIVGIAQVTLIRQKK